MSCRIAKKWKKTEKQDWREQEGREMCRGRRRRRRSLLAGWVGRGVKSSLANQSLLLQQDLVVACSGAGKGQSQPEGQRQQSLVDARGTGGPGKG